MKPSPILYQLAAVGHSVNGWEFKMRSKAVFLTREAAERHQPEFERKCCDPSFLDCAVPGSLKISIIELELRV